MKSIRYSTILLFALTCFSKSSISQTADEIITKHIVAIGGLEAWKKIQSVYYEGKAKAHGTLEVSIYKTVVNGKGMRMDMVVANSSSSFQIVTPSEGWSYLPFQGHTKPERITQDQVTEEADQLDIKGSLLSYQEKGHKVEYLGKEEIEGTLCYKLAVTHKSGKQETIFIDVDTYYILQKIVKQKANGKEGNVKTQFSNYKKLQEGIIWPMSISVPFGEMNLTKVEINKKVNENIFKPMN